MNGINTEQYAPKNIPTLVKCLDAGSVKELLTRMMDVCLDAVADNSYLGYASAVTRMMDIIDTELHDIVSLERTR